MCITLQCDKTMTFHTPDVSQQFVTMTP